MGCTRSTDTTHYAALSNTSFACQGSDDLNCPSLLRLIDALQKYETLNEEDFISLIEESYGGTKILNDFNHLILFHNDNLQKINEQMLPSKCSFKTCQFTVRNFAEAKTNKNDCFYVSIFDSLHVWLYHCFDAGFRLKDKEEQEEKVDENDLFDAKFARINKAIRMTDMLTEPFERINNTKFNIATDSDSKQGDTTFIDELSQYLSNYTLANHLKNECFDTDSLKMDVNHYGNIKNVFVKQIDEIIRFIKMNGNTFSVGMRYYYWDYYKDKEELSTKEQTIGFDMIDNKHDHSAYKICHLFVEAKYSSFKEEALSYEHLGIEMYKTKTIKARKYMKTKRIKKTKAAYYDTRNKCWRMKQSSLHYDIDKYGVIKFYHLFALILYCDMTKLSAAFSATFRRVTKFETLKSMKNRNAVFYWMSRYLRELVEIFGQCSTESNSKYALNGSFYCGMNCKLNVDKFAMRLNAPTSTSKQFEVAVKFSGPQGMIFTFDNPRNDRQYRNLRGWDCSWISNFKQEDEVLFFGGYHRIKVVSVLLMETKHNYKEYVQAIWYFDAMINGNTMKLIRPSKNTFSIISNLINYVLKRPVKAAFDEYVIDTFLCFANNKKHIVLDLAKLTHADSRMNGLILSDLDGRLRVDEIKREDSDFRNLFLNDLLRIFPNVESMTIITARFAYSFSFSLVALLSLISGSNLNEIVVKARKNDEDDLVWTETVWNVDGETLKKIYATEKFIISSSNGTGNEFSLIIKK